MRRAITGLTALVALAAASAAVAADAPKLAPVQGSQFPVRSWVLTLPERRDIASEEVSIRENGRAVSDLSVIAGDEAGSRAFAVVLAIDASLSMRGKPIDDAMAAARAFASQRRPDQLLGLVFFSRESRVALPLTTDAGKIGAALATPPALSKGTRVFDAGTAALRMLSDAQISAGSVVLLSDGADVGSQSDLSQLTVQAREARARLFGVGLESPSLRAQTLMSIANATGGAYSQADSGAKLAAIFSGLGKQLSNEYLVSYRSLMPAESRVEVAVRVGDLPDAAVASYTTPALELHAADPNAIGGGGSSLPLALIAVLVALLVGTAIYFAVRRPRAPVSDRIAEYSAQYGNTASYEPETPEGRSLLSGAESLVRRAHWWPRYARDVELADIGMTPARLAVVTLGGTALSVWLLLATGRPIAAAIAAVFPIAVRVVIQSRVARTRRAFAQQLVETFQVVASAMRAGHSFEGGLAVAAEDADAPMRAELQRIVKDERLGVPLDQAMFTTAERMDCTEFEQVAQIVVAQRQAGGNVAELLDNAVEGLRHKADLRRLVYTLTAQGRFGGAVVSAFPLIVALILSTLSPGYFDPMLNSPVAVPLFVAAGLCVVAGWFVIRRIVDIKV